MKQKLFSIILILTLLISCTQKYDTNEDQLQNSIPINTEIALQSNPIVPAVAPPSKSISPTPSSAKISPTISVYTNTPIIQSTIQKKEKVVYITKTGKKYHKDGCQYLAKSKIPISMDDAILKGYDPCSVCYDLKSDNNSTISKFDETYSNSKPNASVNDIKEIAVYVTKTGDKYHSSGCSYLRRSCIPMDLSDAKSSGYTPCSRCHPPQ